MSIERVFERHGAYHLDMGRDESGKRRSKVLSRVGDGEAALYAALAKVTTPHSATMKELFEAFQTFGMTDLAPTTQGDYRGYIKRSLKPVFGDMAPGDITHVDVAKYLEKRKRQKHSPIGNKEIACLASVFQYAIRNGLATSDPTKGVKRNRVKPKDRYVRDDEYKAAMAKAPEWLQDVTAVMYLAALRPGEADGLLKTQITKRGIRFEESKTGKVKIIAWSKTLRFHVMRASSRAPESPYVFTNSRGEPLTKSGRHSALRRLRPKVGGERWTFHDMRAKGESDSKEGMGLLSLYKRAHRVKPVR
jgi:site-specific recombinase XerD